MRQSEMASTSITFPLGAKKLRILKLRLTRFKGEVVYHQGLSALVGKHHWPALEELLLPNARTTEISLAAFLLQHAAAFRRITLVNINLDFGSWTPLIDRIAGQFSKLQVIKLRGQLEAELICEPIDYIINSPEEFDLTQPCTLKCRRVLEAYVRDGGSKSSAGIFRALDKLLKLRNIVNGGAGGTNERLERDGNKSSHDGEDDWAPDGTVDSDDFGSSARDDSE